MIKPGTVKQARLEAGLSLGQVAREDISRTAIYFVETGKAKPSIETLTLIAERTGKPLDYFLADAAAPGSDHLAGMAELERLLATGDVDGAVAAGLGALSRRPAPDQAARIRFLLATAYLRTGNAVRGRREVALARAHYEQAGDTLMVAECLGTEASAAYLMQDAGALALAEEGLATCRSMSPVAAPTEARLLSIVGAVHTVNHDWAKAIDSYEQAVEVGSVVQDLRSLSIMYGNLSLAYQETDRLAEAARYAHKAMAIYETLNDRLSLAAAENDLALLMHKQGKQQDAFSHANRALDMWEQTGTEARKAHVLMTLAELEYGRSDFDAAAQFAKRALDLAVRMGERANVGEAYAWLGRIAEAGGDGAQADAAFAAAIARLEEHGSGERLSRVHGLYADILEARGELAAANSHLKRALKATRQSPLLESRAASA